MRRVLNIYRSTVGKKVLMAMSGIVFTGFVLGHMYGNLKAFLGPETFNHYAEFLREMGAPLLMHGQLLWVFRIALVLAVLLHVLPAIQLWLLSRSARPVKYARKLDTLETTFAARTMIWGGILIGTFVFLHILHLTTGTLHPDFVRGDAYNNLVVGFQWLPIPILYIVVMAAICLHLYHGVWSALQTLGVNHPRYNACRRPLAVLIAAVVFVGFISVPVGVLAGILTFN
jgi:succinate dehydrogenase / fumarate reductase, cytochrome b subunit